MISSTVKKESGRGRKLQKGGAVAIFDTEEGNYVLRIECIDADKPTISIGLSNEAAASIFILFWAEYSSGKLKPGFEIMRAAAEPKQADLFTEAE